MVFHKTHGMNQPLFSMRTLYVSRTPADSSVYPTISAALDAIPMDLNEPACIYLAPGIYHEKITINKPYLTILGTGKSNKDVVLTYDDYALAPMADIGKLGTFRSYSVFIDTHDVTLQNLTIENASGDSLTHGQAIALYADGDRLVIDSCRLIGHQDTLFTGPLPPKEIEPDGFIGPKQFAPRINGRQYYHNCYICGDIDFIFGSATAYFEHCTLESLLRTKTSAQSDLVSTTSTLHDSGCDTSALCHSNSDMVQKNYTLPPIQGYVTAASTQIGRATPEGQEYGYIFSDCRFISKDCPAGSVYLGRPWRDYAKTILISCELGAHIHPAGFHDWNRENTHDTVYYAEYASFPATSDYRPLSDRADFVQNLNEQQAGYFAKELVLGDWAPDKL